MIPYGKQSITEADIAAVVAVLRGDFLTQGPTIAAFEQAFAARVGAKYAVAVNSATAALHLALRVAGIGKGDRVVTSPITFLASANCAAYVGATPDFFDIDPVTYTLDPVELELNWRDDTRAVVAVDYAGQASDHPEIARVARKHGAIVIEDACHAVGGSFHSAAAPERAWKIGGHPWADMTVFSFHPVKTMTTAEGGMLVTDRADWAEQARTLRSHGIVRDSMRFETPADDEVLGEKGPWFYEMQELGFNYRLTDLQCALGLSQLNRLESLLARRREIVAAYNAAFANIEWLVIPKLRCDEDVATTSWHLYTAQIDFMTIGRTRTKVMNELRILGVGTQVLYVPVHLQPWYRRTYGYGPGKCPRAESFYARALSLPLYPSMRAEDVEQTITAVRALDPHSCKMIMNPICQNKGPTLAKFEGLTVIDCAQCGYAHLQPMPAAPERAEYYDEDFYQKVYPNYIANDALDAEWLDLEARKQYLDLERLLLPGAPRSLIDVGSGPGYFLLAGKRRGWAVRGVEPSRAAYRYSVEKLGLDVVHGYFPLAANGALAPVSVVNCKKVLEHIADPLAFLQAMKATALPGGLVCVSVPNEFNPLQQAFIKSSGKGSWWLCEEHFNYFTPDSLTRLAEKAGLQTLSVVTDFPMELFLLMGDDYTSDEKLGRACHQKRKNLELTLDRVGCVDLRDSLYEAFALCGVGRLVTYIGRVPEIPCNAS